MNDVNKNEDKTIVSAAQAISKFQPQKTGRGIAIFALILSMLSLIGATGLVVGGYYVYWQEKARPIVASKNDDTGAMANQAITSNYEQEKIFNQIDGQNDQLQQIQSNYVELSHIVHHQQQAILNLDRSVNDFFQERYQRMLHETETDLMVVLQLINMGDIEAAVYSLTYIQERLEVLDYPQLLALKKSIRKNIEHFQSTQVVDMSLTLVKLDDLAIKIDRLPFMLELVLNGNANKHESISESVKMPYYKSMWQDFISTIKDGIQVTQLDGFNPILLSPEQSFFIKENLKLKLMDVRLMLLQHRQDAYIQYLDSVRGIVKAYFDTNSSEVKYFLDAIEALMTLNIATSNTDLIKNSIAIVKSLQHQPIVVPVEFKQLDRSDNTSRLNLDHYTDPSKLDDDKQLPQKNINKSLSNIVGTDKHLIKKNRRHKRKR